jgi:hypothetical protein
VAEIPLAPAGIPRRDVVAGGVIDLDQVAEPEVLDEPSREGAFQPTDVPGVF